MKQTVAILTATTFLGLLITSRAIAQRATGGRGGGWGPGAAYGRMYDPKTVETLHGEVTGVEQFTPQKGMSPGVHLQLQTDKEKISVHLGPAWYIERQDVEIAAGDRIEVKGSRVSSEGKPAIIAAEVRKGDETLTLRDSGGFPVWSGWRRR